MDTHHWEALSGFCLSSSCSSLISPIIGFLICCQLYCFCVYFSILILISNSHNPSDLPYLPASSPDTSAFEYSSFPYLTSQRRHKFLYYLMYQAPCFQGRHCHQELLPASQGYIVHYIEYFSHIKNIHGNCRLSPALTLDGILLHLPQVRGCLTSTNISSFMV